MKPKKPIYDQSIDIMLIGYSSAGKSSIFDRYFGQLFNDEKPPQQINTHINSKIIDLDGKRIKVQVFSSFYDKFRPDRIPTYRVKGIIIVYDVTNSYSFEKVMELYQVAKRWSARDIIITLVGNKIDLVETSDTSDNIRCTSIQSVKEFINATSISNYIECSAKYNINIDSLFIDIVSKVYFQEKEKKEREMAQDQIELNQKQNRTNETCIVN